MELLTGLDLEAVLSAEPLQPVTRVLDISLQILSALEEAHGLDVVHRDLKPANVFVLPQRGGGDLVKVVDFGLAKLRSGMSTPGGLVFGTPEYITPEQATAKETDARTDLYACGVMLFEMVTGRLPFIAKEARELLEKHVFEEPPKVADLNADRSIFGLDLVVERAMKKKPEERYQTAGEFADALREIVAHRTGERSHSDRKSWVRTAFRACQLCGNLNPPIARFCGECGETMDRESLTGVSPSMMPPFIRQEEHDRGAPQKSEPPVSGTAPSLGSPAPRAPRAMPAQRASEKVPPRFSAGHSQSPSRQHRSEPPAALSDSALASIREAIAGAEASGDPASALVFLEQIATARLKAGDARSAIEALRRGIDIARADLDQGDLDDPIRVVAIFSSKLGECYLETQEFSMATRSLKDALALSRGGAERARIWLLLSRVARAQGHDGDSAEYLDAAEREAAGISRRTSEPPSAQAANDSSRNR
jgi:serine/threonine protein kinase